MSITSVHSRSHAVRLERAAASFDALESIAMESESNILANHAEAAAKALREEADVDQAQQSLRRAIDWLADTAAGRTNRDIIALAFRMGEASEALRQV